MHLIENTKALSGQAFFEQAAFDAGINQCFSHSVLTCKDGERHIVWKNFCHKAHFPCVACHHQHGVERFSVAGKGAADHRRKVDHGFTSRSGCVNARQLVFSFPVDGAHVGDEIAFFDNNGVFTDARIFLTIQ